MTETTNQGIDQAINESIARIQILHHAILNDLRSTDFNEDALTELRHADLHDVSGHQGGDFE